MSYVLSPSPDINLANLVAWVFIAVVFSLVYDVFFLSMMLGEHPDSPLNTMTIAVIGAVFLNIAYVITVAPLHAYLVFFGRGIYEPSVDSAFFLCAMSLGLTTPFRLRRFWRSLFRRPDSPDKDPDGTL